VDTEEVRKLDGERRGKGAQKKEEGEGRRQAKVLDENQTHAGDQEFTKTKHACVVTWKLPEKGEDR